MTITHGGHVGIGTLTPNSTLHVDGTANFTGNTTVGGTLGITGNTTMNNLDVDGTLDVVGNTTMNNLDVDGTLDVVGNTTMNNLDVDGTLDVSGNSTMKTVEIDDLTIKNSTTIDQQSLSSSDTTGHFLIVEANGTVKRTGRSVNNVFSSSSNSSEGVTTILENIVIEAPGGIDLDNSMSTFVDINSGGTTIGGGLSVGGEFNGRRYFNFLDGSSNTDSSEYITDHYLSSDSNLNMVFGVKKDSGGQHEQNPKYTINSVATDGSYNEVFHISDADISINLQPGSGSRVSVFEATGSLVKLGVTYM